YKNNDKTDKVLDLYDDLIEMLPYRTDYLEKKANYLFENDKLDVALKTLNKITPYEPYNTSVLETIGDIYVEKKNEKTALSFYEKVEKISRATSSGRSYNGVGLEKKINRIKGDEKNEVEDLFKEVTFESILNDKKWVEKYSDEESVILMYNVNMELKDNDNFDVETRMMIKILNEAGAKFWTETNFNFVGQVNSAKVIKPDGREITPEMNYSYAVIKNLAPGDVIQVEGSFEYNMSTEINNESFMLSGLSYEAPIYYQKLEIITKADKELNIACNRMDCESFKTRIEKKEKSYKIRTLERQYVPKMEQEAAVLDKLDAVSWIMVGTMQDWTKVTQWYLNKTYRKLELTYEIKNAVDTIVNDKMTDEEKIIAVYNFITKDIKYSYVSFLQSNFIPKSPASTLSAGIGDCKDVSSLSIAILRYVGIEAYYVLVKTRDFTNLEPIPSILFDHVITGYMLDGKMHYMDLTTDYYPHYVVHEGDSDAWALLVKKGSKEAFRLPDDYLNNKKNTLKIDATVRLNLDKSINLQVNSNANGLIGGRIREEVNGLPINDQKKYISTFFGANAFKNLNVEAFDFGNLTKITPPLKSSFTLKSNSYLDKVSSLFIFQLPLLQSVGASSLLTPATRYNDLDLAQIFEITPSIQNIIIEVPDGYHISEIPKSVQMENTFFKYQLTFEKAGDGMKMHREMEFKERIVLAKDYEAFKKEYLKLLDVDLMKHYIIGKDK
ncbi:MAG: transglutaminase domain-containing protein, partial [Saprospiraceae bacterium]